MSGASARLALVPLPVIDGCTRIALIWAHPAYTRRSVNVLHVADGGDDLDDLAAKVDAAMVGNMWEPVRSTATVIEAHFTPLDGSSSSFLYTPATPAKWKGQTTTGDTVPNEPVLVKHTTAKRGPAYRGRTFLPFCSETYLVDGTLDAGIQAGVTTAWTNFINALLVVDRPFVIASYTHSTMEPVTVSKCEQFLSTQRRRQPRP